VVVALVQRQVEQAADRRLADGATLFRISLEGTRADLVAVGAWLADDSDLRLAMSSGRSREAEARLALALGLQQVDEILAAVPSGDVLARRRVDGRPGNLANIAQQPGFGAALGGQTAYGIVGGEGALRQVAYVPIGSADGQPAIGVLRLATLLDEGDLARFRARTGLDASLFLGAARVATTLRSPSGQPLTEVGPDPDILRQVMGENREIVAWRDLPIGRVRS
jgi:hypothetical protein